MTKLDVMGNEIWVCTTEEAREVWRTHPCDRWRIWEEAEFDEHILDDPEQVAALIQQKKDKPGRLSACPP